MEENLRTQKEGMLSGLDAWNKRKVLNKRMARYEKASHFDKTINEYKKEATLMAAPFIDWFNVKVPELALPEAEPVEEFYPLALVSDAPIPLI